MNGRIAIRLEGRVVEVPGAAIAAELKQSGPLASLALTEAITQCAERGTVERAAAIGRLAAGLVPSGGTLTLTALFALVRLDARESAPSLAEAAARLEPPLSIFARVAHDLLARDLAALAHQISLDDLVAQRAPLVVAALPTVPNELHRVVAALLAALERSQPTLGATAYRSFLGDVAEAAFRAGQHGADLDRLLGDARGSFVDHLCAELPGTPDLVAARGMAWLLGTLASQDDAARSAIERARTRFRDPAFHRDCAAMLGELPDVAWPPLAQPF